jgi:cellulose synthase/poly-beta-1,6-N-acetylglucosamine synthase-like glycosyltransferase
MDVSMLTEDIDSTLRALAKGYRIVHDLNIVSYETAPTQLASFWKQRLRWTQGWTQVSVKYLPLVWKNTAMHGFTQRFGIFSLLFVREASYYLVTQHACLVLGLVVTRFPKSALGLARLMFFQYPVSQWLFIARLVCPQWKETISGTTNLCLASYLCLRISMSWQGLGLNLRMQGCSSTSPSYTHSTYFSWQYWGSTVTRDTLWATRRGTQQHEASMNGNI